MAKLPQGGSELASKMPPIITDKAEVESLDSAGSTATSAANAAGVSNMLLALVMGAGIQLLLGMIRLL